LITIEQARSYYHDNDTAHGFDHVLRVLHLAERIGAAEGADSAILRPAVLLHDVARAEAHVTGECHAQLGAIRAMELLHGQPEEQVARIAQVIREHRFRDDLKPSSIEAKVLYDADKLDAIGAVGIARAYAVAGLMKQKLWAKVNDDYAERSKQEAANDLHADEHTPAHEFKFKLVKLKDTLFTETGRGIAEERHNFAVAFFDRLAAEVAGQL